MKQQHENFMKDLHRLLKAQEFKSEEEAQEFMNGIVENGMPSFSPDALSKEEQAQDLVFNAYELAPEKARRNIEAALLLDPDCIDAYEFLGNMEGSIPISRVFYEKGVAIGREKFGGKFLEEHKGMFWGFHETRPFMRCLLHQAECLYATGKLKESLAILEEMIELNPNDNQGVRYQLLLYLAQLGETKKFQKYDKMFGEEIVAFTCFNRALLAFKTEGETDNSNELLLQAIQKNKYISNRLLSGRQAATMPDSYALGSKEEAECYRDFATTAWTETKGALKWLKKRTVGSSLK